MSALADGASAPDTKAGRAAEAVVAHGHSVMDANGARIGPGGKITLPVVELRHLRKLGFLLGAKEEFVAVRPGPNLTVSDGPTVRLAS